MDSLPTWPRRDVLEDYVSPERVSRIDRVLHQRLGSVTAVFEDIFDPHNVAACVRTCEAYGLQDLHWILSRHDLRTRSTVAKSADQWVQMHRHDGTLEAARQLKSEGFELWVSDLEATGTIDALPLPPKVAIVVGNAKVGISEEMRALADRRYILPMWGFVQSFNLSVALAITLDSVAKRRRAELAARGERGDLDPQRLWQLRRRWLEYGIDRPEVVRRQLNDLELT
jgi:tRNA (guanosine-2'-O-)-methyltransferase